MKTYMVMLNGKFLMESRAVSPIKAINNARYRLCKERGGWFNVPPMHEFDAVES